MAVDADLRDTLHAELDGALKDPDIGRVPFLYGIVKTSEALSTFGDTLESLLSNLDRFNEIKDVLLRASSEGARITEIYDLINNLLQGKPPITQIRNLVTGALS